ncbi:MAG: hypothetical protein CMH55_02915 [Myxococcales bacterium]|nr:hypothetical protein [Myxococcales bacterium]|tara:strand:- start:22 stop:489 length:468 start_codon:yes stop_codon:yes gene_type:complete
MAQPPFDPELKTDPGGNKAIAAVVCLCFGFYLIVPSLLHHQHVASIVNHGVEVLAETESCSRRGASRARTVLVRFEDAKGKDYRCLASIKTKCKEPFKRRWVTYKSQDPNQCLVGKKEVLEASWRSALGLVFSGILLVLFGAYLTHSVLRLKREQ